MHGDYAVSLTVTQFSSQATNHSRKACDCSFRNCKGCNNNHKDVEFYILTLTVNKCTVIKLLHYFLSNYEEYLKRFFYQYKICYTNFLYFFILTCLTLLTIF